MFRWMDLALLVPLSVILNTCPTNAAKSGSHQSPAAIHLRVWPSDVTVPANGPIPIEVALENTSSVDRNIRLWLSPAPFGSTTGLQGLLCECRDVSTGAHFDWIIFPPGMPVDAGTGVLTTSKIPHGTFLGRTINMADYCHFKPGDYSLVFWYDTRTLPSWVHRADHPEWKGITNKVTITIHVRK